MTAVLPARAFGFTAVRAFAEHKTHFGRSAIVLHEIEAGAARTSCYTAAIGPYADDRDGLVDPVNLTGRVQWCDRDLCWSGHRRCVVCSAPAGDHCECGRCIRAAIERAAA